MNEYSSSSEASDRGRSFDSLLVRSFQADDRPEVLRLHAAAAPDGSVDCDCATHIHQIEEKYFRRPQDHFWVAEAQGQIVGTVAISVHEQCVAHLSCLRAADDAMDQLVRRALVHAAASHAHHHGCLKLVVHAQVDVERATEFMHRLGFEFSRRREVEKRPVLEFYLNLYERPELGPMNVSAPPDQRSPWTFRA